MGRVEDGKGGRWEGWKMGDGRVEDGRMEGWKMEGWKMEGWKSDVMGGVLLKPLISVNISITLQLLVQCEY